MATTPRTIRFDDDIYKDMMGIAKRPLTASYHIQEACRQYLKQFESPTVTPKSMTAVINKPADDGAFDQVWDLYGKKGNRKTSKAKYLKLSNADRLSLEYSIGAYVLSTPDKQYRKNLETYINQECWNDEVIQNGNQQANRSHQSGRPSAVDRVRLANERARAEREAARISRGGMGASSGDIRLSTCDSLRGDDAGSMGDVIEGNYSKADQ